LIAGAFQIKSNAENLISQLKAQGLNADFAGMRGDLHLVSVGSFSTKMEANEAKQAIKNQSAIKCWILERK
jgi:cell division septation protein DedD